MRSFAARGDAGNRLWQAIPLQTPDLPPEEQSCRRHNNENLEKDPDVEARKDSIEGSDVRAQLVNAVAGAVLERAR